MTFMNSSRAAVTAFVLVVLFWGVIGYAEVTNSHTSNNGYTVFAPTGWKIFTSEYTTYKGGKEERVVITQETDLLSRTTKYIIIYSGTPESVFNLSPKVISRITKDELVDFYIDQLNNGSIDLKITKTWVKGTGDTKEYVIEGNYAVPGHRMFTTVHITFRNGKAYLWSSNYLASFSNYAPILQTISDSILIR